PPSLLKAQANEFLTGKFGGDSRTRYIADAFHPWVYLNQEVLRARGLNRADVATALAGWLKEQPGIKTAYTQAQLLQGANASDSLGQLMQRSFDAERCGDVGILLKTHWILWTTLTGTTHGSPQPYDTHVPLIVYGPGMKAGPRSDRVRPETA